MSLAPSQTTTPDRKAMARAAGVAYLVIIACGVTAEFVLRAPVLQSEASDMAAAVLAHLADFRLSMLADATMIAADILLALLFYALLRGVHQALATAVLVFRLIQAAIIAASLVLLTMVPGLALAGSVELVPVFLGAHATGYDIGLFFFGMNSLLMWRLLSHSGGAPGWIAAGIGAAGVVYIAGSVLRLARPDLLGLFEPAYLVPFVAETALCVWLLVRGRI